MEPRTPSPGSAPPAPMSLLGTGAGHGSLAACPPRPPPVRRCRRPTPRRGRHPAPMPGADGPLERAPLGDRLVVVILPVLLFLTVLGLVLPRESSSPRRAAGAPARRCAAGAAPVLSAPGRDRPDTPSASCTRCTCDPRRRRGPNPYLCPSLRRLHRRRALPRRRPDPCRDGPDRPDQCRRAVGRTRGDRRRALAVRDPRRREPAARRRDEPPRLGARHRAGRPRAGARGARPQPAGERAPARGADGAGPPRRGRSRSAPGSRARSTTPSPRAWSA